MKRQVEHTVLEHVIAYCIFCVVLFCVYAGMSEIVGYLQGSPAIMSDYAYKMAHEQRGKDVCYNIYEPSHLEGRYCLKMVAE